MWEVRDLILLGTRCCSCPRRSRCSPLGAVALLGGLSASRLALADRAVPGRSPSTALATPSWEGRKVGQGRHSDMTHELAHGAPTDPSFPSGSFGSQRKFRAGSHLWDYPGVRLLRHWGLTAPYAPGVGQLFGGERRFL
jgi:hypothetical protein